jgi:uncharacterized phage protein gp47/JayE
MPSPDITPYIDLTLYDKQPEDVYADAIRYAQAALPEWSPVSGSVEDAILQATSTMTADLIGAINRLPSGLVEVLLKLFGVTRNAGVRATGAVWFEAVDDSGYTIPAGTRVGYLDGTDIDDPILYTFDTDEALSIPQGQTAASVTITAALNNEYPALQDGEALQLITPVPSVDLVTMAGDLEVGADAESDTEYFARAIAKLHSYTAALVLPTQFEQYILATYTDVYRAKAYSRVNPANNAFIDPPENGYVTIYVSRVGGASLSAGAATVIEEDLANRSTAGLNINVEPATVVEVEIATTVTMKSGFTAAEVEDAVLEAIDQYVHPDYWDWSPAVYYNELISLIDHVEGVDRVTELTIEGLSADYNFTEYGVLPINSTVVTIEV